MSNIPRPSNFVSGLIALLIIVGVFGFIYGLGAGRLQFTDTQFGLIAGFLFGAGGTILAFHFGSNQGNDRTKELLATTSPAPPPARPAWTPEQRAAMTGKPTTEGTTA